jgi:cobalt-zinc-cadmium efflux system outer membrane protein
MPYLTSLRALLCLSLVLTVANVWSSTQPTAGDFSRLGLFINQIQEANPEIQAAQAGIDAAQARFQGAAKPIYNPEMTLEGEKVEGDGSFNYAVGLSQTFDTHNKRGAGEQVSQAHLEAIKSGLSALRQAKIVGLLDAIAQIENSKEIISLTQQRLQLLERFQHLAEQRHQAGDVPLIEVELARLAVAEAAMAHAQASGELIVAKGAFFALAGAFPPEQLRLPASLPTHLSAELSNDQLVTQHPQVKQALLKAQAARWKTDAIDRDRRSDPTLGVMASREDDANKLTLSISMPLQIRNNFSSQVTVAHSEALQIEQEAQQIYRTTLAQLQTARDGYMLISQAWQVWVSRGQRSLKQQSELLEQLWQAGELETTEYLVQLQQNLDTRIAGAELHGALWNAWVKWLAAAGQVSEWVGIPADSATTSAY